MSSQDTPVDLNDAPEPLPDTAPKVLSPAAQRALNEAEIRRAKAEAEAVEQALEEGGPQGAEPTRYGDWERKGIAVDF